MTQQTLLQIETATEVSQLPRNQASEHPEKEASSDIAAILIDATVQVGALIDAVCCRIGEWVDWQHYRPHPSISAANRAAPVSIVRLALAENDCGLRAGGYIEMCLLPKDRVIEVNGGYYDAYHQPQPVIDGSLNCHEVNHQRLGQALMLMYDRIIRAYMIREMPDDSSGAFSRSLDRNAGTDRLRLEQQGAVQGDWQLVKQSAGPIQNPIKERIRR